MANTTQYIISTLGLYGNVMVVTNNRIIGYNIHQNGQISGTKDYIADNEFAKKALKKWLKDNEAFKKEVLSSGKSYLVDGRAVQAVDGKVVMNIVGSFNDFDSADKQIKAVQDHHEAELAVIELAKTFYKKCQGKKEEILEKIEEKYDAGIAYQIDRLIRNELFII